MKKTLLATLIAGIALTGCDAELQDSGTEGVSATYSGRVIDPYIVGAKVYADVNNNGQHDVFEDYAFTDADGSFQLNLALEDSVILRTDGGFDKVSVQENAASLSVKVAKDGSKQVNITPVSSLLHQLDDKGKTNLAGLLSVNTSELEALAQTDFIDDFKTGKDSDGLVKNLAIHKPLSVLTAKLEDLYDNDRFDDVELPDDFGSVVYDEFADALQHSSDLDTLLTQTVSGAEQELQDLVYEDNHNIAPPVLGNTTALRNQARQISELVANIATNQSIEDSQQVITEQEIQDRESELNGLVRAVDVVNAKIIKGENASDISTAITQATTANSNYYQSLESTDTVNINAAINANNVANVDVNVDPDNKFDFSGDYTDGFVLRFTEVENGNLASDYNYGSDDEDTAVQLYFQKNGKLTVCAKITIDEDDLDDDFNIDTSGFILNGKYTKLNDIAILTQFKLLGNTVNPVITLAGADSYSISLDSEGLDEELNGVKFSLPDTIPGTDRSCKAELNANRYQ